MGESETFNRAARRIDSLMSEIHLLVLEEREFAERDESFPKNREARFAEKNRMMEQAMREMTERFQIIERCNGVRERNEALRTVEEIRGKFRETMHLVQETQTAIRRLQSETYREIRTIGLRNDALRAYRSNR